MLYPNTVQLETTTACNAHCGFCPHSVMEAKGRMSDALLSKLIAELASWDRPLQLCPFLTNEPFADPRLFDILAAVNAQVPKADLTFFTNASLLTEERVARLAAVKGIESIHCSLHHITAAAYEAELGLPLARTLDSIHRLLSLPTRDFPVYILRVSDSTPADSAFIDFCRREFPGAQAYVAPRWNWKGDIASPYGFDPNAMCPRHTSLCVLASGRVALCCMDQNGAYAQGDVNESTLLEVYNGAIHARYATQPKCANEPCKRCNMR